MQLGAFTEEEFEEVLRCTAPWKACGVDSVNSFPIKKCPPIKKAVFHLIKKMIEWKAQDRWDEDDNWLLEGRTVLIFKGGDRKDPANYRPHHLPPDDYQDGHTCHPQDAEGMALWER